MHMAAPFTIIVGNQVILGVTAPIERHSRVFSSAGHCGSSDRTPKCDPIHKLAEATIARACPVAEVKVDNVDVKCLVDTGTQVTLFS